MKDLETALRRIHEHTFLLEDERALKAYGMHSAINRLLAVNRDGLSRIAVILIDEPLGF